MAINLETLQATLRLQSDQFRTGMAQARADLGGLKKSVGDIGKRTAGIGKTLTAGVTLPIVGAGVAAVNWATDTNESINKVNEVFEGSAGTVRDWSKTAATSLGVSQGEALAAAGTIGNLGKGVGVATADLDEFSISTIQAASDLASFNNADPSDVLADIQSGLVGEVEPLRKYGILLNAATVNQRAMEMTGKANAEQLTEGEKVMARQALIMEQLGDAEGDFARTSGGLANKTRILKAQMKDLGAQFGAILLPLVTRLANGLGKLMERFSGLSTRTKTIILVIAGIAAALGPLLIVIGSVAAGIAALAPVFAILLGPIGLLILAIGLLTAAYLTNFFGFQDLVDDVMGSKAVKRFLKSIEKIFDGIVDIGKALKKGDFGDAFDGLKKAAAGIGDFLAAPAKAVGEFIRGIKTGFRPLDRVFRELGNVWVGLGRLIQEVFQGDFRGALDVAQRLAENFMQFLANLFRLGWEAIALGIEQVFGERAADAFRRVGEGIGAAIGVIIDTVGAIVGFLAGTVVPAIASFAQDTWNWITGTAIPAFARIAGAIGEFLQPLVDWIVGTGIPNVRAFADKVRDVVTDWVIPAFHKIFGVIASHLDPFMTWLFDVFLSDLAIFVENIKTQAHFVIDRFRAIWDDTKGAFDKLKDVWGEIKEKISAFADQVMALVQPIIDAFGELGGAIDEIPDLPDWLDPRNLDVPFAGAPAPPDVEAAAIAGSILKPFEMAAEALPGILEPMRADAANTFVGLRNDILQIVSSLQMKLIREWTSMSATATSLTAIMGQNVANEFVGLRNSAVQLAESMNNRVTNAFVGMRNSAVALAASLVAGVLGQLSALPLAGFGVGQSLGLGIAAGIRSTIGTVAAEAASLVANAIAAARIAADASSPSRMMMALGDDLATGLSLGITAGQRQVSTALAGLVAPPSLTAAGASSRGGAGGSTTIHFHDGAFHIEGARDSRSVADEVFRTFERELALRGL